MPITLLVMYNETVKRFHILWNYKFNIIIQLLTIGLIFVGATYFIGGGQFTQPLLISTFLGYIVWFYARIVIMSAGADIAGEAQGGTLEQMYMTPAPVECLILGRMISQVLSTTLMVTLTSVVLVLLLHIQVPLNWEALPVLLLTLSGLFGFTLLLTGAALVFKQTDALADLLQNLMLFLTGSLLPISHFPQWLAVIAQTLPITQGIIVLRSILLNGQSLSSSWANGSLVLLLIHSSLYLLGGWFIFKWCERVAKRQGSLSHY